VRFLEQYIYIYTRRTLDTDQRLHVVVLLTCGLEFVYCLAKNKVLRNTSTVSLSYNIRICKRKYSRESTHKLIKK
jgi:hypothetical protein